MDKKNTTIGILLIAIAGYLMFSDWRSAQEQAELRANTKAQAEYVAMSSGVEKPAMDVGSKLETEPKLKAKEEFHFLETKNMKARISSFGASISDIEFKTHKKEQGKEDCFVFNEAEGITSLSVAISKKGQTPVEIKAPFTKVDESANGVVFETIVDGLKITRKFGLDLKNTKPYSPNSIWTETTVENISGADMRDLELWLGLGSATPTEGDINNSNLELGVYDGDDVEFFSYKKAVGSDGFLGFWATPKSEFYTEEFEDIEWATVKNQPFAAVFTADNKKANKFGIKPVYHDINNPKEELRMGMAGYVAYPINSLKNGEKYELSGFYYAGAKDVNVLEEMGKSQELLMNFGFFSFVSKPLLSFLNFIHGIVATMSPEWAWGWSIVILTCCVRLLLFPLTNKQYRSSMRMSLLAGSVKAIREKNKKDPQKAQREIFALYGEYGINPMAGCLPALIQLPIFLGLYFMLQSVGDFRFAHFLWINDLALPDTLASMPTIFGMPLHILPLLNAAITVTQMSLTPMPSAEPAQKIMMKALPVVLLLLFYSFPSGLLLYWTVQSTFGLVQLLYVRFTKESLEQIKAKAEVKRAKRAKKGPSFMEKMQTMAEQAQKMKEEQARQMNKAKHGKKKH